ENHASRNLERDLLPVTLRMLQCVAASRGTAQHRRRVFLRAVVGFFDCVGGKRYWRGDRVSHQSSDRPTVAQAKAPPQPDDGSDRARCRARRVEDHPAEPTTSTVSDALIELPVWLNADPISH